MKAGDRYEIELGFWTPLLVVIVLASLLVFAGYKLGEKRTYPVAFDHGYESGAWEKEQHIAAQIGNRALPMRAAGNGYWCRRIK
jgi:hypothetical protein